MPNDKKVSDMLKLFLCAVVSLCSLFFVYGMEPVWIRVLPGALTTSPAVNGDRIFSLTDNRSVTCLSATGDFLWSRPVRGKNISYLQVTGNGMVYILSRDGFLTVLSRDGMLLWTMRFNREPVAPPYRGKDGRNFFLFRNAIVCMTDYGSILWNRAVLLQKFAGVSRTGDGILLLYNTDGTVLMYSPFGSELGTYILDGIPGSVAPLPSGFAAGFPDGTLEFHDVRTGAAGARAEKMWQIPGPGSVAAVAPHNGTLYCVYRNGTVSAYNETDGTLLWNSGIGIGVAGDTYIDFSYGRITVLSAGLAASFDENGSRIWVHAPVSLRGTPKISVDGRLYGAGSGWTVAAFNPEDRILARKNSINSETYGILNTSFSSYPYANTSDQLFAFFDRVEQALSAGDVGDSEPVFARWLSDILAGSYSDPFSDLRPDSTSRGRAASLLGRLGSHEYRPLLLAVAQRQCDESLAIGIIYGLSRFGPDTTGESVRAIHLLAQRAGVRSTAVQFAACDALSVLARFSSDSVRDDAVRILTSFSAEPWNDQVRNYARKTLESLLQ